jgi:heme-degrading monooxygenase HmoA
MSESESTGTWIVKPGEEAAFIEDWTKFVEWASTMPGATTFRLGRDTTNPSRFVSFAPWADAESQRAWISHPEFPERLGKAKAHTTAFESTMLEVVSTVAAAASV